MLEKVSDPENKGLADMSGPRYSAVKLLNRFERSDSYIDKLLQNELNHTSMSGPDKALLNELVNGIIRWKSKLDWVLTGFYHGEYQKCLNIVKNAMRVALYQIMFLSKIPHHAAINESVEIVKKIQGQKTANIVNGVLRNIARNLENIRYPVYNDDHVYYYSIIYSHPKWVVKKWLSFFGEDETVKLLQSNNRRPYIPIRVNTLKMSIEELTNFFLEKDLSFANVEFFPNTVLLYTNKGNVTQTRLFQDGKITVQDPSQSVVIQLADVKPGMNVLDLCGAPGGKAYLAAEMMKNDGKVVSIDKYSSKVEMIEKGAERLGIDIIKTEMGDAMTYSTDFNPDVVLADVPCTGLGTLSKKPDIKWKRDQDDITILQNTQRQILENAAKILKPGGVLIYSTCTIEPEENEDNIKWFLEKHPDFKLDPAENYVNPSIVKNGCIQIMPHVHKTDGSFAARLIKQ